jgi:hypothetical protein
MASPTQMHNVLCRSVTIEARLTASSRSSGSHRNLTDLYRASNSQLVRRALWKALYVQDGSILKHKLNWIPNLTSEILLNGSPELHSDLNVQIVKAVHAFLHSSNQTGTLSLFLIKLQKITIFYHTPTSSDLYLLIH